MTKAAEKGKELVAINALVAKDVFADGGVEGLIKTVKDIAQPKEDADTKEGREERRSMAYNIARTKKGIDDLGKDYVADLKKVTKDIDVKRKMWRDTMELLQDEVRKPLTDYENKEKERISAHQTNMEAMRSLMAYDYEPTSEDVEKRIASVSKLAALDYEEFSEQATTVADNSSGRLAEKLAHVIKSEEQAAELEKLRLEKAEQERLAAEEKIRQEERDRIASEAAQQEAVDHVSESDAVIATMPTGAGKTGSIEPELHGNKKTITSAEAESEPCPSREYKKKINNNIVTALVEEAMITDNAAKAIVTAIVQGKIPNVMITY